MINLKIVAIGGGNNSNVKKDGSPQSYEQMTIDKEIISLSKKENPNVLFISHASFEEFEQASYNKIVNTYNKMYNCPTKLLDIKTLQNFKETKDLIMWADIIYIGGGNTKKMIELWKKYNFDILLKKACLDNKILCGISAGANSFFSYSCSDYLKMELNDENAPFASMEGLGFIDLIFNPHVNYEGRFEGIKQILKQEKCNGLSLSNNVAIEIIDDKYKIIKGSSEEENIFYFLSYWKNNIYCIENIKKEGNIKELIRYRK